MSQVLEEPMFGEASGLEELRAGGGRGRHRVSSSLGKVSSFQLETKPRLMLELRTTSVPLIIAVFQALAPQVVAVPASQPSGRAVQGQQTYPSMWPSG